MAAITDAMNWYNLGASGTGATVPRLKYLFHVNFFVPNYTTVLGEESRLLFKKVRSVELPKFAMETELLNSWNLRVPITTKVMFEPISIVFNDTEDNIFQKFINKYMTVVSGNFTETTTGLPRTGFDAKGLNLLDSTADTVLSKIEIIMFNGMTENENSEIEFNNYSKTTLWRPKIVDVQHDILDYSASEAVTWTISLRYESVTYEDSESN